MAKAKHKYTKDNVLAQLEEREEHYNMLWIRYTYGERDDEKAKMYLDMKTAIQNLIIDFELEFE